MYRAPTTSRICTTSRLRVRSQRFVINRGWKKRCLKASCSWCYIKITLISYNRCTIIHVSKIIQVKQWRFDRTVPRGRGNRGWHTWINWLLFIGGHPQLSGVLTFFAVLQESARASPRRDTRGCTVVRLLICCGRPGCDDVLRSARLCRLYRSRQERRSMVPVHIRCGDRQGWWLNRADHHRVCCYLGYNRVNRGWVRLYRSNNYLRYNRRPRRGSRLYRGRYCL